MIDIIIVFLVITVGSTVIQSLIEVITTFLEWIKAIISVHIVKCNAEIEKIQHPPARAIGFTIQQEEEGTEDES